MQGEGSWRRRLVVGALIGLGVGAGWWGGRVTLVPPPSAVDGAPVAVVATVQHAAVGRTLTSMVTVDQPFELVATNGLAGVVTAVGPGGLVATGDVLFEVGGRPVVAVDGEVPFHRDLASGARGTDVEQLQRSLNAWGFAVPVTGRFDPATTAAVRTWQQSTGQERTGVVPEGTMLAIPDLPAVVQVGEAIMRGARVSVGDAAVLARVGDPSFSLHLPQERARLVPLDARVDVMAGDHAWEAVIADVVADDFGQFTFTLSSPDGGPVCGEHCGELAQGERSSLRSEIHVVPPTSGPAVPVAALGTDPDGSSFLTMPTGTRTPVTVLASGDGLAVVDGVAVGTEILLFGTPPSAGTDAPGRLEDEDDEA